MRHGGWRVHLYPAEKRRAEHGGQDHDDRGSEGGAVQAVGERGPGGLEKLRADAPGEMAGVQRDAGDGLAELLLGIDPNQDPEAARKAGSVLHALFIGIVVMWFMDPKQGLSAPELTEGLRILAEHMTGTG